MQVAPGKVGSKGEKLPGRAVHLLRLLRGLTPAVIQDVAFSACGTLLTVSSARGTTHIYRLALPGDNLNGITTHDAVARCLWPLHSITPACAWYIHHCVWFSWDPLLRSACVFLLDPPGGCVCNVKRSAQGERSGGMPVVLSL